MGEGARRVRGKKIAAGSSSRQVRPQRCIAERCINKSTSRTLAGSQDEDATMLDITAENTAAAPAADASSAGPPADFQAHLANLEARGLLVRIERQIDKNTELHPLVRWQFAGGIPEDQRRAFLF